MRRIVASIALGIVVAVFIATLYFFLRKPVIDSRTLLAQLPVAFKMYSNVSTGNLYPPVDLTDGCFIPDLELFGPFIDQQPDAEALRAYLNGAAGVDIFYSGFLLTKQSQAQAYFPLVAAQPDMARIKDLDVPDSVVENPHIEWPGPPSTRQLYRLRMGIERFLMTDIGNPGGSKKAKSLLPVIMEVPREGNAGGWVLYDDGHSEWMAYPSSFPMTEVIVEKVRELRADAQSDEVEELPYRIKSIPPKNNRPKPFESPMYHLALEVADSFDKVATKVPQSSPVRVGAVNGYRMGDYVLFPEEEILPDDVIKKVWPSFNASKYTAALYLGKGRGYHWFGKGYLKTLEKICRTFELEGGEDMLPFALQSNDLVFLARFGDRAIPHIKFVIEQGPEAPDFSVAMCALAHIGTPDAEAILLQLFSKSNPQAYENLKRTSLWNDGSVKAANPIFEKYMEQLLPKLDPEILRRVYKDVEKIEHPPSKERLKSLLDPYVSL